jgi:hypothetical protein
MGVAFFARVIPSVRTAKQIPYEYQRVQTRLPYVPYVDPEAEVLAQGDERALWPISRLVSGFVPHSTQQQAVGSLAGSKSPFRKRVAATLLSGGADRPRPGQPDGGALALQTPQ